MALRRKPRVLNDVRSSPRPQGGSGCGAIPEPYYGDCFHSWAGRAFRAQVGERGREWLTPLLPSLPLGGVDALLPSVRVPGGAGLAVLVPSLFPVLLPRGSCFAFSQAFPGRAHPSSGLRKEN